MKKTLMTLAVTACTLLAGTAFAAETGCATQAADKKLAGAAKASFMKKCEREAKPAMHAMNGDCAKMAGEKKLAGAAKTSYMKKCEREAAAPAASATK
ncbi:MAG: hypothetical protein KGI90_03750 [Burkholderiales bacterium]|nr:hypothetical protein [Burkholderiales bacterium]MDE2276588.1 hypothetical protein [Burkholderiales bacterium]